MSIVLRLPEPEEDPQITEDARAVAAEIRRRNYAWTDGYENSFAEFIDRIGYYKEDKGIYESGSNEILKMCRSEKKSYFLKELGLDTGREEDIIECCSNIARVLKGSFR